MACNMGAAGSRDRRRGSRLAGTSELSTVHSKYATGGKPLLTRQTHGNLPRHPGGTCGAQHLRCAALAVRST